MINSFPIGSYKILTYYELKDIQFNNGHFQLANGKNIYGLALVRVLCPSNLLVPFLSYRSSTTGRNSTPCCKSCADIANLQCDHSKRYVHAYVGVGLDDAKQQLLARGGNNFSYGSGREREGPKIFVRGR